MKYKKRVNSAQHIHINWSVTELINGAILQWKINK